MSEVQTEDAEAPGARSSSRRILHCDMDSFYASIHQRDQPELRGKPIVVGGDPDRRGVVAAASYEARQFGIRSAMPSARARRLCPQALFLKPEFTRYREESKAIFALLREFTDRVQPVSIDEAYLDVTDAYHEYGSATALARSVRGRIWQERQLTVSVGVGPNRLIAKIASDCNKPDGLTVVPPYRVLEFLAPMAVRRLQGVGPATERVLREELEVHTVADLRRVEQVTLRERFGRFGDTLFGFARGIDDRLVVTSSVRKSYSSERTYDRDLVDRREITAEIERQARGVARGLARHGLSAATVTVKVRYDDFTTVTRSLTLASPSADESVLVEVACRLMGRTEAGSRPVRLLGVGGSKLHSLEEPQQLDLLAAGRRSQHTE